MSDSLVDCGKFRLFNVIDDYNRESLAIEVDTSLPSLRVIPVLTRLVELRGKPAKIRSDMDRSSSATGCSSGVRLEYLCGEIRGGGKGL